MPGLTPAESKRFRELEKIERAQERRNKMGKFLEPDIEKELNELYDRELTSTEAKELNQLRSQIIK